MVFVGLIQGDARLSRKMGYGRQFLFSVNRTMAHWWSRGRNNAYILSLRSHAYCKTTPIEFFLLAKLTITIDRQSYASSLRPSFDPNANYAASPLTRPRPLARPLVPHRRVRVKRASSPYATEFAQGYCVLSPVRRAVLGGFQRPLSGSRSPVICNFLWLFSLGLQFLSTSIDC